MPIAFINVLDNSKSNDPLIVCYNIPHAYGDPSTLVSQNIFLFSIKSFSVIFDI
jgi:hypothetical protein